MMNNAGNWLYAIECVVLPILWGLLMVWATSMIEKIVGRKAKPSGDTPTPEPEADLYSISPEYHI